MNTKWSRCDPAIKSGKSLKIGNHSAYFSDITPGQALFLPTAHLSQHTAIPVQAFSDASHDPEYQGVTESKAII
jgi:hypothetical protein